MVECKDSSAHERKAQTYPVSADFTAHTVFAMPPILGIVVEASGGGR